jgi:hypothetical protein
VPAAHLIKPTLGAHPILSRSGSCAAAVPGALFRIRRQRKRISGPRWGAGGHASVAALLSVAFAENVGAGTMMTNAAAINQKAKSLTIGIPTKSPTMAAIVKTMVSMR